MGYTSQAMNEFAFPALSRRLRVIGAGPCEPTPVSLLKFGYPSFASRARSGSVGHDLVRRPKA
jgi:hypothetical protein